MRCGLLLDLAIFLRFDSSTEVGLTRLSAIRPTLPLLFSSRIGSSLFREFACILFLVLERARQDLGVACCDLGDERPSEMTLPEVF